MNLEVLLGAVSQEGQDLRVAVIMKTAEGCHNNENSCSQTHFLSNNDPLLETNLLIYDMAVINAADSLDLCLIIFSFES